MTRFTDKKTALIPLNSPLEPSQTPQFIEFQKHPLWKTSMFEGVRLRERQTEKEHFSFISDTYNETVQLRTCPQELWITYGRVGGANAQKPKIPPNNGLCSNFEHGRTIALKIAPLFPVTRGIMHTAFPEQTAPNASSEPCV